MGVDVMNYENVGMIESAGSLGLLFKSSEANFVSRKAGRQNLDGDFTIDLRVEGAIHLAHAALAYLHANFVTAYASAGINAHVRSGPVFKVSGFYTSLVECG